MKSPIPMLIASRRLAGTELMMAWRIPPMVSIRNNNPEKNSGLFQLPLNTDGSKAAYVMGDAPYIEGSVGIGNLFKIFRIDLVKRFNYLDHSHVSEWGLRMRFRLDF